MSFSLTARQAGIYFDQLKNPSSTRYTIGASLEINSVINVEAMGKAIHQTIAHFDLLSMVLETNEDGECTQHFNQINNTIYEYLDYSQNTSPEKPIQSTVKSFFSGSIDILNKAPLFSIKLYKFNNTCYKLLLKTHHIIADGYAIALFVRVLLPTYREILGEESYAEHDQIFDFKEEIISEKAYLGSPKYIKDKAFWQEKIANLPDLIFHNTEANNTESNTVSRQIKVPLQPELQLKLHKLATRAKSSFTNIWLAALVVYYSRVNDREKLVIGTTSHNRNNYRKKYTFGPFAGDIPCIFACNKSDSLQELLKNIALELKRNLRFSNFPQSHLAREFERQHANREHIFDMALSYEHREGHCNLHNSDIFVDYKLSNEEPIPLVIRVINFGASRGQTVNLTVHKNLMDEAQAHYFLERIFFILEQFCDNPADKLTIPSIDILPKIERKLLHGFAGPVLKHNNPQIINVLLEQSANQNGYIKAVSHRNEQWTYNELNKQANKIAHYLLKKGIKKNQVIVVYANRSNTYLAAMMAIWKSGGIYVPIDIKNPAERVQHFLLDANPALILTEADHIKNLPHTYAEKIVDLTCAHNFNLMPNVNPSNINSPEDPAYIIYTSGSTGVPKGAMIQHSAAVHHIHIMLDALNHTRNTQWLPLTMLQSASASSDISLWQFIAPIATGGKTVIMDDMVNMPELLQLVQYEDIQLVELVPVVLRLFIDYLTTLPAEKRALHTLRWMMTTGDAVSAPLINEWFALGYSIPIVNAYGPTEAADDIAIHTINTPLNITAPVPIGRPLANTSIHIVNRNLELTPLGEIGELCVAGDCVGLGYVNDPQKTAESFVENPFFGEVNVFGNKLYRTGDLAYWDSNGLLHFIGRRDNQVKIHGQRIELGDIEACLARHAVTGDCAVIIAASNQGQEKYLHAFLTIKKTNQTEQENAKVIDKIKSYIRSQLPSYMVPRQFTLLDEMPRNLADKIDRKALAEIKIENTTSCKKMETEIEVWLAKTWAEIIGIPVDTISHDSKFFMLGGDSILCVKLVMAIRSKWNVEIEFGHLFESSLFDDQVQYIKGIQDTSPSRIITCPENLLKIPVSTEQKRIWFADQLNSSESPYNANIVLHLRGTVNIDAMDKAFCALIARQEILRTCYFRSENDVYQVVGAAPNKHLSYIDLSNQPYSKTQQAIAEIELTNKSTAFDLENDMMIRSDLIQLAENEYYLIITIHHIASDGWSQEILLRELSVLYSSYLSTSDIAKPLPELPVQYKDYAYWQKTILSENNQKDNTQYWVSSLNDAPTIHSLPLDFKRPAEPTNRGQLYSSLIHKHTLEKLYKILQSEDVTLFMALLATFSYLLHRYSDSTDILVGSPVSNRDREEVSNLVGFFVNTLVYKTTFEQPQSFLELLRNVKNNVLDVIAHKDAPFEQLVEALKPDRSTSYNPLFQVLFTLEENIFKQISIEGMTAEIVEPTVVSSMFDLDLTALECPEGLKLTWCYASDLFKEDTIKSMATHFENLLISACENPHLDMHQLSILSKKEKYSLIYERNNTRTDYPRNTLIHQVFERWVAATPNKVAVSFETEKLTYNQLNKEANKLANYLKSKGVQQETLIGLHVERSIEMIIAILAVLKSGGAYLPLDPDYPAARLDYLLNDSQVKFVITNTDLAKDLTLANTVMLVDIRPSETKQNLATQSEDNLNDTNQVTSNLAYVIYTSGSTGNPKGVMIEHDSVVNLATAQRSAFELTANSRALHFASLNFDASVFEWILPLLNGASLFICNNSERRSPLSLSNLLIHQKITHATMTPSLLAELPLRDDYSLQALIIAGEPCNQTLIAPWVAHYKVLNAYGPTEATVCATVGTLEIDQPITIGSPIANTQVFILNRFKSLQPSGAVGELYIGGAGVGRGYLNQPALSKEKFIDNPFGVFTDANQKYNRLYRTGDLVRYLHNGNLEFIGRVDDQVKIRGVRIELGEIENHLNNVKNIQSSVVLARKNAAGKNQLVAYIVIVKNKEMQQNSSDNIRKQLAKYLPDYMLPSQFVVLEHLPLTANGKVDKASLLQLDTNLLQHSYIAPSTETELALANIIAELLMLKVENIGVNTSFFELGGHSLLVIRLINEIRDTFHCEISVKTLFENSSVGAMADVIDVQKKSAALSQSVNSSDSNDIEVLTL